MDGRPYVWPVTADLEPLQHLLAELLTPEHPHQYDYPPTQIDPITAYLEGIGYKTSGKGIMYVAGELRVVMIHAT